MDHIGEANKMVTDQETARAIRERIWNLELGNGKCCLGENKEEDAQVLAIIAHALAAEREACEAACYGSQELIDKLRAELATVTEKYQNLVTFYDQHVGTPCEQIRHEQEVARLRAACDAEKLEMYEEAELVAGQALERMKALDAHNARLRAALEKALKTNGVCVAYKGFPHTCTNTALCEAHDALTDPHV